MGEAALSFASGGRLADNIAYFGRALRDCGLSVGPGHVLDAVAAVEAAGVGARADFYFALRAVFVSRPEDIVVFDEAFRLFWRRRAHQERLIAMLSPVAVEQADKKRQNVRRRVEEALFSGVGERRERAPQELEFQARFTASDEDVLRTKDFADMSADELKAVRARIARLRLPDDQATTRRLRPDPRGRLVDLRAMLRASLSTGGDFVPLRRRGPKTRPPPIVALLDISGSMADYSRPVLHFLHALTEARGRVATFLFGTRLTNVTRALKGRDPDAALEMAGAAAQDWSGGTRIASSLHTFNKDWSRRVMGQNPVVLLITDGLERDPDAALSREIDRLHRSCRRLVWLNPLLGYEGFAPRAQGIKALLPHVDDFRPVHNLASLEELVTALAAGR